jgi:DNA-binding response OmpR family regulator
MKILLIEDDFFVAKNLTLFLKEKGHYLNWAKDGKIGLELAQKENYHLIITDYLLPGLNGQELISRLRAEGYNQPIMAISVCKEAEDKAKLLNEGADDYLVKPFLLTELEAKIGSLARRQAAAEANLCYDSELELNPAKRELRCRNQKTTLTNKEFLLLKFLMTNPGRILSYQEICEQAWEEESFCRHNLVEVYILKLREKLKQKKPSPIETVSARGYRWREKNSEKINPFQFY